MLFRSDKANNSIKTDNSKIYIESNGKPQEDIILQYSNTIDLIEQSNNDQLKQILKKAIVTYIEKK